MTTIEVTADDIEQGEPCEGDACPIHRAMRRVLKHMVSCDVLSNCVWLGTDDRTDRVMLPKSASEFVDVYDKDGNGIPFSFNLDIPDHFLRAEQ